MKLSLCLSADKLSLKYSSSLSGSKREAAFKVPTTSSESEMVVEFAVRKYPGSKFTEKGRVRGGNLKSFETNNFLELIIKEEKLRKILKKKRIMNEELLTRIRLSRRDSPFVERRGSTIRGSQVISERSEVQRSR